MRVLLVLRPAAEIGGLEKILAHAVKALQELSVETKVLVFGARARESATYPFFAAVVETECAERFRGALPAIAWADVVHFHAPTMTYWSARLMFLVRLLQHPALLTVHLPSEPRPRRRLAGRLLANMTEIIRAVILRSLGTFCYAPSAAAAEEATRRWRRLVRVEGLIQGIPDPGRSSLIQADDCLRVALVGRLADQKNPLLFLDSIALARAQGVPVRAEVVGDGPLRGAVERRAQQSDLGPEAVIIHGHVDDALPLIANCALLVLTSTAEGCPVVVMESAALGRPALVREGLEGVEEILGEAYFKVPRDSGAENFASCYERLSVDRQELQRAGAMARHKYEQGFSLVAAARRYHRVYESCIRSVRPRTERSES